MNRLYNLDYLRGLAAFGIMIYHYFSWAFGNFNAGSFMGRLGIYGVAIFYILSGLTLFYVYENKLLSSKKSIIDFMKKRIFRIFPLLWLVTIITIILSRHFPNIPLLILNLTGAFGFIKWNAYYATGAWSIGNELVFYTFFPFFMFFYKKSKVSLVLLSVIIFSAYLYFAFDVLNESETLAKQWKNYINPLNQIFLFLGGFLIGLLFKTINITIFFNLLILIFGLGIFVFFPAEGDTIHLVIGNNRIIFTFSCFLICLSFYKLSFKLPLIIDKPLVLLGETSYSIYLIHPIFYRIFSSILDKYIFEFREYLKITLSIILTLIISYFVYKYFERFFMEIGKKKFTLNNKF